MKRLAAGVVTVALAAAGCALFHRDTLKQKPQPATFSQYHLEGWSWERVDRVLVLPFLQQSPYTRTANEVRAAFTSEMQRMGRFEVVSAPPDDRAALAAQIHDDGRFDEAAMLDIARATNADVIIHGIVTQYSPYPRPRMGLIIQAVAPRQAKVVGSVDGLWDTTDMVLADRCRIYYRQRVHPRPPLLRNNLIANDDSFAAEIALESPALFQRWVCHEAVLALMGLPVPGVISSGMNSKPRFARGELGGVQADCGPTMPTAPVGNVK